MCVWKCWKQRLCFGKSRFGCYCVFCYQLQSFSLTHERLGVLLSITTELEYNLYQDVDSQCICIYILYTFTSFWKCILQTLNMMRHFKADYSYIVQLMYGYRILLHSSHLIPGTSERFRTVQKYRFFPELFRTISNYFRTICFLCPAYHRTVPNGSEVAYVIWAPLLGWDKFRLDWFKQSYFSILLKTVFIPSRACNITHVMCTLSIVLLFYWVIKIKLCQENRSIE